MSTTIDRTVTDRSAMDRYIRAARDAGCPRDQIANFIRAKITLQPRQLRFAAMARECDRPGGPIDIAFGGARGGGKSTVALAQVVADDCSRVDDLKFLYIRKVGKSGKEAIHDMRRTVLHSVRHEYRSRDGSIVLPNGSRVILGHYQAEKDIDNYLGLEYDGVLIEEATQLSHRKVVDIGSCVRTSKPRTVWRPRKYLTTNPGNIGHAWFKERFIEPHRIGRERDTRFVPATVYDNRFINPEYREGLESLTGWQRRAWLHGDWDISAGQFFTNFRRESIEVDMTELPRHWRAWLGFDYGFTHYTCIYLLAADGDGTVYVVDEHAERGWLPDRHAAAVSSMLARWCVNPWRLETIAAGHDVFSRDRQGKMIADDYAALGFSLEKADIDRVNGAAEMLRRFGDPDRGLDPTIRINRRCARLLDCIPALRHDPNRPEDVLKVDCDDDGIGGDDAFDACRYGLMHVAGGRRAGLTNALDSVYRG